VTSTTGADWGRVDDEGTVYVRTADGERAVGSWQAGAPEEGLAFFVRKYDGLAAEVELIEQRLGTGASDPKTALTALDRLAETVPAAAAVGDLAALAERVDSLREQAKARLEERKAARVQAQAEAVARKTALAEEAEQLAESSEWKAAGDRLRVIGDEWREIRVERPTEAALWKRFRTARDAFTRRRGAHFAAVGEQRKTAAATKERLAAEAETLAESTQWTETGRRFRDLMTEWKAAGRAGKDSDDILWGRFRAAQDRFFAHRSEAFAARDAEVTAAVKQREQILETAERLDLSDLPAAQTRLRDLVAQYDKAGRVPREVQPGLDQRMRRAEQRVRDAADAQWRSARVATSPMVERLHESIAKLERRLERARAAGDAAALAEVEESLATQRAWLAQAEA
jgi:hypothetical protein